MKFVTTVIGAAAFAVGTAYAGEVQDCSGFSAGDCGDLACHCISPTAGGHTRIAGQSYSMASGGIAFFNGIPIRDLTEADGNNTMITLSFQDAATGEVLGQDMVVYGVKALLDAEIEYAVPTEYEEAGLHTFKLVLTMDNAALLAFSKNESDDGFAYDPDVRKPLNSTVVVAEAKYSVNVIPGGVTLLPLLCTLTVSALTREVYVALASGIFVGSFIRYDFNFFDGLFKVFNVYVMKSIADDYHALTMIFTTLLGGLVAVTTKSGGMYGLAENVGRYASTPRYAQLSAYLSGWIIFFDDYANALVVGNTFRPITDMVNVSREKLAFIVDATSAPIASIMPVSAWIAYEVGLINDELSADKYAAPLATLDLENKGYLIFLETIPSRYYPFVMLFFQCFLIITGLEFGPMLTAERRSRYRAIQLVDGELAPVELGEDDDYHGDEEEDPNLPDESTPRAWWNGFVVIIVLIGLIIAFMVISGLSYCDCDISDLRGVFGNTDPFTSLVEGTLTTSILTFLFYRVQYKKDGQIVLPRNGGEQLLPFKQYMESFITGMKHLMPAVFVLILAWAYGDLMKDIGTADFFGEAVGGNIDGAQLPGITFILSALIALATGTSWGTMAIMFPLVTSTALDLALAANNRGILIGTLSSILAGSVFGDHCSPISDTTVLSSIATRCELQAHVLTQAPYAIFVGTITVIFGDFVGTAASIPPVVSILICTGIMMGMTMLVGAPVNSSTGRLDMFGRLYAFIFASLGRGETLGMKLQHKAAASEAAFPTFQFDPLGSILGGGVTASPNAEIGNFAEVKEAENKIEGAEFAPAL